MGANPIAVDFDGAVLGTGGIYSHARTGVYRYVEELLGCLAASSRVDLRVLASGRARWNDLPARHWLRRRIPDLAARYLPADAVFPVPRSLLDLAVAAAFGAKDAGLLSEQALAGSMQALGMLIKPDRSASRRGRVYHSPAHALPDWSKGSSRVLTIHDVLPVLHPEWFPENASFKRILASLDLSEDWVICVSENTRRDFLSVTGMSPDRVFVSPLAPARWFRPVSDDEGRSERLRSIGVSGPFVLCVATLEPRKNLASLLEAWKILRTRGLGDGLRLVLAGAKGWKTEAMEKALQAAGPHRKDIVQTGFVPDTLLPDLYSACEVFCFPSLYEGFGLPPLEALACGAVVHCVRGSSLPEVVGEAGIWSESGGAEDLADGMERALALRSRTVGPHAEAVERASRFTWQACADRHVEVYARIAASS